MITADPNHLRYGAQRFSAAAQEMQRHSAQLEQTTNSIRLGQEGWSGAGSQAFLLRGDRLAADAKKASSAFESVAHTLSRFAMRMEHVLELRRRADRLDQQAFEYGDETLDSIHTRQNLRHQAAQLRHQADAEARTADSQASSEFQIIAKMIPPTLIPGAEAVSPLLEGLPKHWQDYYRRHPELLEEEKGARELTADEIEANRRADALAILIEYHKQTQSPWLSEEDRVEAARVFCEQAYSVLSADDLENEIDMILAEEERNYKWQEQIQSGAYGKELIVQDGYTEYALKQYYQDGAFLGMAAAITAAGGYKRSKNQGDHPALPRISEIELSFKRNPKHDSAEFERQLKDQEEGINSLTVDEFITNRNRYLEEGRAVEGNAAQKLARQEALKDKVMELRKQGLSRVEANEQAEAWLKDQAALHNPDQIAGGNPHHIGGMGDRKINSSIGSQWRSNSKELDKKVRDIAEHMTQEDRESTLLNVKLKE